MRCLDANIWIYYLDETLPEHDAVTTAVHDVLESETIFTTTVLQMEVIHYLNAQLPNGSQAAERFLSLSDMVVAEVTSDDVRRGAEIMEFCDGTGVGGRDATVLAAMERYDVPELWTHDTGLNRASGQFEWLRVVDPLSND